MCGVQDEKLPTNWRPPAYEDIKLEDNGSTVFVPFDSCHGGYPVVAGFTWSTGQAGVCEMSVTAAGTRVGLIKTSSISADIRGSGAPAGFYGFKMLRDPSDSKISETSTVLGFPFKGARMVIQLELQWSSLQVATLKSLCGTESREVTLPSLSADDSWTLCTTVPHNQRITLKSAVAAKTKAPDPSCQYAVSPLSPLAPCTCPREPHVLCVCVCVRGSCTCPGEPHVWCVCVCVCVWLSYACIDVSTNFCSLVHNFLPRRPSRRRHSDHIHAADPNARARRLRRQRGTQ